MAKRYSPLTVALLTGAFALLGYMGARVSERQASRDKGHPPAVNVAGKRAAAPSERNGSMGAARTPADAPKPIDTPAKADAQTALAQPLPPHETVTTSSAREPVQTGPSLVLLNAGSAEQSRWQGLDASKGEMLSNRTNATRSDERQPSIAERGARPPQPALSESEIAAQKPRGKPTRTQPSRDRDVVEGGGPPRRSYSRRYAARGDMRPPPGPGIRLLPLPAVLLTVLVRQPKLGALTRCRQSVRMPTLCQHVQSLATKEDR